MAGSWKGTGFFFFDERDTQLFIEVNSITAHLNYL